MGQRRVDVSSVLSGGTSKILVHCHARTEKVPSPQFEMAAKTPGDVTSACSAPDVPAIANNANCHYRSAA
jgi:hypothetical protein